MESEEWETSSEDMNEAEAYLLEREDEEDYCNSGLPKLQFRKDISKARWNHEMGMAEVVEKKGNMWKTTGVNRGGQTYCSVEETLFLAEIGALLLMDDNDACLSLKDIYAKVAEGKNGCCWENFEAYRHLKSLGYIVCHHGVSWSIKSSRKTVPLQGTTEANSESNEIEDKETPEECSINRLLTDMQINDLRPAFDVYLPNSKFRKSSPGDPSFVLFVTGDYPPSQAEIEVLEKQCRYIPLKFCHVENGRVSSFSFDKVELPILP